MRTALPVAFRHDSGHDPDPESGCEGHLGVRVRAPYRSGQAAELAYLLRHNGAPIASTFDADGRRPARHVAVLEFVCRLHGNPAVGLLPRVNRAVMCCAGG
jgi:hypothetical protein